MAIPYLPVEHRIFAGRGYLSGHDKLQKRACNSGCRSSRQHRSGAVVEAIST